MEELLARISSRELAEWMAYYEIEPFGEERADVRAALVASTVANVHRGKKRRAYKLDDFMPRFERKTKQTADDMLGFFRALESKLDGNNR